MNWYDVARYCEETYDVPAVYDEGEEYFFCPQCDEPICKSDWEDDENLYFEKGICPICGEQIVED